MNELQVAKQIACGALPSPQHVGGYSLFSMRISGTGFCERGDLKEIAFRDPGIWTSPEMLQRCNGLPVIWEHPANDLNSQEFEKRAIGAVFLPYVADDLGIEDPSGQALWGVAKIYPQDAIQTMLETKMSTSPACTLDEDQNVTAEMTDGTTILIESDPERLDHLAACELGIWDKDGPPSGIRYDSSSVKELKMPDEKVEEKPDLHELLAKMADGHSKLMDCMDAMSKRMDAAEAREVPWKQGEKPNSVVTHPEDLLKADEAEEAKRRTEAGEPQETVADRAKRLKDSAALQGRTKSWAELKATELARKENDSRLYAMASRFDHASAAWGKEPVKPYANEPADKFRVRAIRPHLQHCADFAGMDADALLLMDSASAETIQTRVLADSVAASERPSSYSATQRHYKTVTDPTTGHRITTGYGPSIYRSGMRPMFVTDFLIPKR